MESRLPLFLSYSQEDFDKVVIAENEINKSKHFYALVIARNNEPLKLLEEKVEEGILKSHAIVPILTSKSMNAQWINQEIAFARGKILIIPIVENCIIDKLKGFVHKERDLPYNFNETANNSEFLIAIQKLLKDLEMNISKVRPQQPFVKRNMFDSVVETLQKHKIGADKQQFFNSPEGRIVGITEAKRLFQVVDIKTKELKGHTVFPIKAEQGKNTLSITVRSKNLKFVVCAHFVNHLTKITVSYVSEHRRNGLKLPNKHRVYSQDRTYSINEVKGVYGWTLDSQRSDFFTSEEIANYAFSWMANELTSAQPV